MLWINSISKDRLEIDIFMHSYVLLMRSVAQQICGKIPDYHKFNSFQFTPDHVLKWVGQFDSSEQAFILDEFLHLLNQNIYLTENAVRQILIGKIAKMTAHFKEKNPVTFLRNADIL